MSRFQNERHDPLIEYLNSRERESQYVPMYAPNLFAEDPLLAPSWWERVLRAVGIIRRTA